ncbi:hypothetical protein EX30DRAFT_340096 [Ascodesmis nigricans]|uniref:Uncharacterized protein n=1 Tax=Ascodesmis nigricans TaxID=341454 RepID=A0A4S2MZG8_9PEZI|nr:hypothetical protein EX30DRAFT_340096 [Ascodesmis nigricans]
MLTSILGPILDHLRPHLDIPDDTLAAGLLLLIIAAILHPRLKRRKSRFRDRWRKKIEPLVDLLKGKKKPTSTKEPCGIAPESVGKSGEPEGVGGQVPESHEKASRGERYCGRAHRERRC